MGIKKLNKFIHENNLTNEYPNLEIYLMHNKQNNKNAVFAIDFWLYAYKFSYSYGDMLIGFWNQAINFLSHRIIPLYIFDGKPPNEKQGLLSMRQKKKKNIEEKLQCVCDAIELNENENENGNIESLKEEKRKLEKSLVHITKLDIQMVKQMFDTLNVPFMVAKGEADSLCAKLYKEGKITACLSDDMDMLALGCGKTIKFVEGKIIEFDLVKILEGLKLNQDEFVDMCILFGCDYIRSYNKLNYTESYELIKKYKSIENILMHADHEILNYDNDRCSVLVKEYPNVQLLFKNACDEEYIDPHDKIRIIKIIGVIDVIGFLTIRCPKILKYRGNKIKHSIDYINNHIVNNFMNV
jgi:5'-3' exonuclease